MWLTALLMGVAGSLHCAGMCSPLVMALTSGRPFQYKVLYNAGRILTYGSLGLIAGEIGSLVQIPAFQGVLSLVLGSVMILMGLGSIQGIRIPLLTAGLQRLNSWLRKLFGSILRQKNSASMVSLGFLNGLLPCGLTYLAATYCFTLDAGQGFTFMLLFGLGTFPVMLGLTWILGVTLARFKPDFRRISTVIFLLLGTLLIGRVAFSHHQDAVNSPAAAESGITVCR